VLRQSCIVVVDFEGFRKSRLMYKNRKAKDEGGSMKRKIE